MLRALAGYLFGGPQDKVPQEQVECETKEVNDWLVVNMPDQPEDNIDLDAENDDNEMEIEDMDDVLWCLSNWFASEEAEPEFEEISAIDNPSLPQIRLLYNKENMPGEEEERCISFNITGRIESVPRNYWQILPLQARYKKLVEEFQSRYCSDDSKENASIPKPLWIDQEPRSLPCEGATGKQKARELFLRLRERNVKKAIKGSDVTCHPVYSKTYVNHRHPALSPPKTDLLQKIKELEPEQRATQQAMKKHISRGQLNRQNKNYIYDTSTKKNRRKNLQRNPSGANNNRKCCY